MRRAVTLAWALFACMVRFGLLRMRRWGYAIVLAGCLLLSASYFYVFTKLHIVPSMVQGLFMLLFFLYLVRPEVRDRMV